jgi:hypothetical protein
MVRKEATVARELEADNFMILDMESGNAVAFYDSEPEARRAFRLAVEKRPEDASELMLVAYDKFGRAVDRVTALSLLNPA